MTVAVLPPLPPTARGTATPATVQHWSATTPTLLRSPSPKLPSLHNIARDGLYVHAPRQPRSIGPPYGAGDKLTESSIPSTAPLEMTAPIFSVTLPNEKAREGNVADIALVLKMRGALPGDLNWEGGGEEVAVGAAFTVEELAQRAIDRGYVVVPKALKDIDGET